MNDKDTTYGASCAIAILLVLGFLEALADLITGAMP